MAETPQKYETKVTHAVRGMEARTKTKWESEGWELVEEDISGILRTKFTFRRPVKSTPKWLFAVGTGVVLLLAGVITIGALTEEKDPDPVAASTASPESSSLEASPSPGGNFSATPTPEASIEPTPTAEADPNETTLGLDFGWAQTACNNTGEEEFPYGFDGHTLMGLINEEVQGENYFLKYTADVTNGFNAEREVVVECTVTGTNGLPSVVSFYAY